MTYKFLITALAFLIASTAQAAGCDDSAIPALECPTGYEVMCVSEEQSRWGCGRPNPDGTISEVKPVESAPVEALAEEPPAGTPDAGGTAPSETPVPQEPSAATAATSPAPPSTGAAVVGTSVSTSPGAAAADAPAETTTEAVTEELKSISDSSAGMGAAAERADEIGGVLEEAATYAPESLASVLGVIASTLAVVAALLGLNEIRKRRQEKKTGHCSRCDAKRTGAPGKCAECDGLGTTEEEYESTATCPHCKGEGTDPCHACKGEGCDACGDTGKTQSGDPKKPDKECCTCHGRAEQDVVLKRQVPCQACGGSGRS